MSTMRALHLVHTFEACQFKPGTHNVQCYEYIMDVTVRSKTLMFTYLAEAITRAVPSYRFIHNGEDEASRRQTTINIHHGILGRQFPFEITNENLATYYHNNLEQIVNDYMKLPHLFVPYRRRCGRILVATVNITSKEVSNYWYENAMNSPEWDD